jgi:hypothetical protein
MRASSKLRCTAPLYRQESFFVGELSASIIAAEKPLPQKNNPTYLKDDSEPFHKAVAVITILIDGPPFNPMTDDIMQRPESVYA